LALALSAGIGGLAAASPLIPDDPYFAISWHAATMELPQAWSYSRGSVGVVVAVVDTGVIPTEPDLQGRVLPPLSVFGPAGPADEDYRHGTWVASALSMGINNGIGGVGVGQFSILPVQATIGDVTKPEWIADGIRLAADHGARVINVSLHALTYGRIDEAARYARSKGALTFIAAGNDNMEISMPAYDNLIFVSGTDRHDHRWGADPGSTSGSTYGPFVDLSAPAQSIVVADSIDPNLPHHYGLISGTSFAAPLAAGAAALAWSINPNLTADQVESMLYNTALDLGKPGWDKEFGWGRVNAGALAVAAAGTVPEPAALRIIASLALCLLVRRRCRS